MVEQIIASMKEIAAEISKINPEFGGYAWRKINYLGDNPTLKAVVNAASDIALLAEKAGVK